MGNGGWGNGERGVGEWRAGRPPLAGRWARVVSRFAFSRSVARGVPILLPRTAFPHGAFRGRKRRSMRSMLPRTSMGQGQAQAGQFGLRCCVGT
jgi:hypothetical protein